MIWFARSWTVWRCRWGLPRLHAFHRRICSRERRVGRCLWFMKQRHWRERTPLSTTPSAPASLARGPRRRVGNVLVLKSFLPPRMVLGTNIRNVLADWDQACTGQGKTLPNIFVKHFASNEHRPFFIHASCDVAGTDVFVPLGIHVTDVLQLPWTSLELD